MTATYNGTAELIRTGSDQSMFEDKAKMGKDLGNVVKSIPKSIGSQLSSFFAGIRFIIATAIIIAVAFFGYKLGKTI